MSSANRPKFLQVHQPVDACALADEEAEAEKETQGLELKDMAGPLILAVAFCLLGTPAVKCLKHTTMQNICFEKHIIF